MAKIERPWSIGALKAGYRVGIASGYKGEIKCESNKEGRLFKKSVNGQTVYFIKPPKPFKDKFNNELKPQAQIIFTYENGQASIDAGIGLINTLSFKLNL